MRHGTTYMVYLGLSMLLVPAVWAQQAELIPVVAPSGGVYIYHTALTPYGAEVHIARQRPGDTTWVRLTDTPLRTVASGQALQNTLGPTYDVISTHLGIEQPTRLLARLRSNRVVASLASFTYPEVADALGRRVLDPSAQVGQAVRYRLKIFRETGEPEGISIETEVLLQVPVLPAPQNLSATHEDDRVTLRWTYPANQQAQDRVYHFALYRVLSDGSRVPFLDRSVARNDADDTYEVIFRVPEVGVEEHMVLVPIHMTGEPGPAADLHYTITDTEPPAALTNVLANLTSDSLTTWVEVSWLVAPEADAQGYHVYRRTTLDQQVPPTRLTTEPLDLLTTFFRDSTLVERSTYYYEVTVLDEGGNESTPSPWSEVYIPDTQPPPPVLALSADVQADGSVQVRWTVATPAPDLRMYSLLRGRTDLPGYRVLTPEGYQQTAFTDTGFEGSGLQSGVRYRYGLVVVDDANNASDTTFTWLRYPDTTPPDPPVFVHAEVDANLRAQVRWDPSPSPDAVAYIVQRARLNRPLATIDTLRISQWTDDAVVAGETYVYAVAALDSLGNRGPATTDTLLVLDATPPRVVRNVRAVVNSGQTEVMWEPVPAHDLAGYRLFRAPIQTGVFEPVTDALLTETSYVDPDGAAGFWYIVRAVDTSQNMSRASVKAQARR